MAGCSKKYLNGMLEAYSEELQDISRKLQKNLEDMDFANARTREDMQFIIDGMKADCKSIENMIENSRK